MKYIAIISYGHDDEISVSFVSPTTGLVDKIIDFEGFANYYAVETVRHFEPIGEPAVVYDHCVKQRYEIGDKVDLKHGHWYADKEGTKIADESMFQEEGWEYAIMLSAEKVGSYMCEHWREGEPPFKCYEWKITAQRGSYEYRQEWRQDLDVFYNRFKKEYGLELPLEYRLAIGVERVVELVAEKYGIELINILRF